MNCIQKIVTKIGIDKVAHFFGSAFLVLAFGLAVHWVIAVLCTALLGIAKELLDKSYGGAFDKWDLVADGAGIALSAILLML